MKSETLLIFLRDSRENTGRMAGLRCLLRPSQRMRGWMALGQLPGAIGDRIVETIAGLYAMHPLESTDENYGFGSTCRKLARLRGNSDDSSPLDTRFRRLLACTREDLLSHLPEMMMGLKSADIPVNYGALYTDLQYWSDRVRERWAIQYWTSPTTPDEDEHVSD